MTLGLIRWDDDKLTAKVVRQWEHERASAHPDLPEAHTDFIRPAEERVQRRIPNEMVRIGPGCILSPPSLVPGTSGSVLLCNRLA